MNRILTRLSTIVCLSAVLASAAALAYAQESNETATDIAEEEATVLSTDPPEAEATELAPPEPFRLPTNQHRWASYETGAWREIQTVTESLDEKGNVTSRNVTTQKEVLEAIVDGKYILQVQATIELGGKRIVGETKNRVLHLEIDHVGPITASQQLENKPFSLAGLEADCEVWEIAYQDDGRGMIDRVHYTADHYPFILHRVTCADEEQPDEEVEKRELSSQAEEEVELIAREVPRMVGKQLVGCSLLRKHLHRAKGDTVRLAYTTPTVPGGEVFVEQTDFDADGVAVRRSLTTLLGFGVVTREVVSPTGTAPQQ